MLIFLLTLGLALPVSAAETSYPMVESGVKEIQKYGNIVLDVEPKKLHEAGYDYGDILAVTINGKTYQIPLCTNFSEKFLAGAQNGLCEPEPVICPVDFSPGQ